MSRVTEQALRSSVPLRLRLRTDAETFVRNLPTGFLAAAAEVFRTSRELVSASVVGGLAGWLRDGPAAELLLALAVQRRDGTAEDPALVRALAYLGAGRLAAAASAEVRPASLRPRCRLGATAAAALGAVVTEVAPGVTWTDVAADFRVLCPVRSKDSSELPAECTGPNRLPGCACRPQGRLN